MSEFDERVTQKIGSDKTDTKQGSWQSELDEFYATTKAMKIGGPELLYVAAKPGEGSDQRPTTMPLTQYLSLRAEEDKDHSYFHVGMSKATRLGRQLLGMQETSSKFDEAIKKGDKDTMQSLYYADMEQRKSENSISKYSSAMLKTGFLFGGGKLGLAGLTTVSSTDEARPADPFQRQLLDATLGAAKGIATRFAFEAIKGQTWDPIAKGWTFGMSDRFIDAGLSATTYENQAGEWDLMKGAQRTFSSVLSPQSLIVDGATVAAPYAVLYPLNNYLGGAIFKHPLGAKITMAAVSGLTSGSLKELNSQQDIGMKIDWMRVAKRGGEKSALDAISALPNPRGF